MKTSLLSIMLAGSVAFGLASCSGSSDSVGKADGLNSFDMDMTVISGEENFLIESFNPDYKCYLTVDANIQWPRKIGDYDIKALQDTLIAIAFPDQMGKNIDSVMVAYLNDADMYQLGDSISKVDEVPALSVDNNEFYNTVKVQLMEVSDELVTFNVSTTQYMGGAHPNSGSAPFTYDLTGGNVIDFEWLFKEGSEESLLPTLREVIAAQLNISEADLEESLLSPLCISSTVYILDGSIVFHYNPYAILPYSFGTIDAIITPFTVSDLLTQQAKELFGL